MRQVEGLRWAHMLERKPACISDSRPRGAKSEGLRYERSLAKGLGAKFRWGMWWEYRDDRGMGYCQTDFFGKAKQWVILLEGKLTWTTEAEEQLHGLYVPVVACALGISRSQVLPIVVCKNLTRETDRPICDTLRDAIEQSMEISAPFCPVWHHIGGIPMLKRELAQAS